MTALAASFWAKTERTDCLIWTGAVNTKGYPCYAVDGVSRLAHRLVYEDANGPIPDGLTIDHLCRVRNCVNPDHLEAVTDTENKRRARQRLEVGGTCRRGHLVETVYTRPSGATECPACRSSPLSAPLPAEVEL